MGREDGLKDYVEVNVRIMKFYEKYPEGRIITDLVSWENGVVIIKATVYRDDKDIIASTGYAYEKEGSSFINKTSALENCETSAVGRALAILGFEIKKSIASYEEVANAKLNQDTENKTYSGAGISDKQVNRLLAIGKSKGVDAAAILKVAKTSYKVNELKDLNKNQYDEICKRLESK